MRAYMKSTAPFYGVQKAGRVSVLRKLTEVYPLDDGRKNAAVVRALWRRPHREERYLAIAVARRYPQLITLERLPLYEKMIREGAWWDLVDEIATKLIGRLWLSHRSEMNPWADEAIASDDMWIRRTAIIGQLGHKQHTDHRRLFRYCRHCMSESEFFIRKAIGWALREYAKTDPDRVRDFVDRYQSELSGLSYREAVKHF